MSYSEFTFTQLNQLFNLTIKENLHRFPEQTVEIDPFFKQYLSNNIPLASAIGTEKAKSEMIIAPILRDDILRRAEMPCLVIEILSPPDKIAITVAKIRAYLKLGVKSYWLVFPDLKAIAIYSAGNDTQTFDMQHTEIVDKILDIHLSMPRIFATKT